LAEQYAKWLFLLPVSVFLFSSYQALNYWLIRRKKFRISSANKVSRRLAEGSMQAGIGLIKNNIGLIAGDISGNLLNFIQGIFQVYKNGFKNSYVSLSEVKNVLKTYSEFPKFNLVPALLNTVCTALPFLLINRFYGSEITGYFGLSKMVLAIPIAVISTSLSQVLLQRITEKRNNGLSISKDISRIAVLLLLGATVGSLVFNLWGTEIITFLFNDKWHTSGVYIQVIVFASAINFIVSPLTIIFIALEKIRIHAIWQVFYFLLILSLYLATSYPIVKFLKTFVIIDLVAYMICSLLVLYVIKQYEQGIRKHENNNTIQEV
jgi:O-antigen/teichoic acid export membrane protein